MKTARIRQPTHDELADLETRRATGLATAAASTDVKASAATAVKASASTTVTDAAASTADNCRRRTDLSHTLDDIAEFALAAMRFVVNN
ncbi:MAG: hypothetical protein WB777_19415 [Mycobacterium sp.]